MGDERQVAVTEGQLGTLALMEGDYGEARRRYREALARFRRLGETQSEAILWHQLGRAAEEERRLAEAEEAYGESLRLTEQLGDAALAATSANQLAIVARRAGRPADAERWFWRAIELDREANNPKALAIRYNNLANLLLNIHHLDERPPAFAGRDLPAEAEQWAQEALSIVEAIGDPSLEIWKDYGLQAKIATARNRPEEAQQWHRQERAAYAAFPGHWYRYQEAWAPRVTLIAAAAGGEEEATEPAEQLLAQMAATDDWRNLAAALRDVIEGHRDADSLAEKHDLDNVDYLIMTKALGAIQGADAGSEPATVSASSAGGPTGEDTPSGSAAPDPAQMEQITAAFRQWLGSPEGRAAAQALEGQGLGQEALGRELFGRFAAGMGNQGAERGGNRRPQAAGLEEALNAALNNTAAVLTRAPQHKEEWWQALGELQGQVAAAGEDEAAAFLGLLRRLLEGASFAALAPEVPAPFAEAWAALEAHVAGDNEP